jgi:hypothetical protein
MGMLRSFFFPVLIVQGLRAQQTSDEQESGKSLIFPVPFLPIRGGVRLYQPRTTDDEECGAVDGTRTGRGNRARVTVCPPQILYDLTCDRNRWFVLCPSYYRTTVFFNEAPFS